MVVSLTLCTLLRTQMPKNPTELEANSWRLTGNSPGNKRVNRLFPVITDGAKRRPLLGSNQ